MLVDPNTGMPIEMDTPESLLGGALGAQSASAGALSSLGQQAGFFGPGSIPDATLDAIPGLAQTTAWNTFRGSRSILYGTRGVSQISGVAATLNPLYAFNMPSYQSMGGRSTKPANYAFGRRRYKPAPPGGSMAAETYTPFNIMAKSGNFAFRNVAKAVDNRIAAGGSVGRVGQTISALNQEGPAFSVGALGRISAMSKVARGRAPYSNVMNFIESTDSKLYEAINMARASAGQATGTLTRQQAVHAMAMSMDGAVTGRVGGFMATMLEGEAPIEMRGASRRMGAENVPYRSGAKAATKILDTAGLDVQGGKLTARAGGAIAQKLGFEGGEKVGAKVVGKLVEKGAYKLAAKAGAALAVQAVPVVGQIVGAVLLADLAMDVGKLGVEVFKSGVDFAKEAAISYKGSINKGVMGMGYRDNTVAATSRARGVQAIQNSRLNARSVLGSEAGAMHAHFG